MPPREHRGDGDHAAERLHAEGFDGRADVGDVVLELEHGDAVARTAEGRKERAHRCTRLEEPGRHLKGEALLVEGSPDALVQLGEGDHVGAGDLERLVDSRG